MMNARAPASLSDIEIDVATIRAAHERIRPHILRTPVLSSPALDEAVGAQLFFKCENLQRVSAFKARGACNAVLSLSAAEAKQGVVTHSSGNHGVTRLSQYAAHLSNGRADGNAQPRIVASRGGTALISAASGLAYPA